MKLCCAAIEQDRYVREVVRQDWSALPRVDELGLASLDPREITQIATRCTGLIQEALDDLGVPQDPFDPLRLIHDHVILRQPWPAIVADRLETTGRTLTQRQFQNRQKKGARQIAAWAAEPRVEAGSDLPGDDSDHEVLVAVPAIADRPQAVEQRQERGAAGERRAGRDGRRLAFLVRGLASAVVLAAAIVLFQRGPMSTQGSCGWQGTFPSFLVGRHLEGPGVPKQKLRPSASDHLKETALPDLGSPIVSAMGIPGPDGGECLRMVFGTAKVGHRPGSVVLWDTTSDEQVWEYAFRPPCDEVRMKHESDALLCSEPWDVRYLGYVPPSDGSEGRIVAVCWQKWFPTFVLFLAETGGRLLGRYAHPGQLYPPVTMDLDGDGDPEVVLGGCDNELKKPVLTVLDPLLDFGAACSVDWAMEEAALFRVVLPTLDSLQSRYSTPPDKRFPKGKEPFRVHEIRPQAFNADTQVLNFVVGLTERRAYHVYLKRGSRVMPGMTVRLGTAQQSLWKDLGIPLERARDLEQEIQVIWRGDRCEDTDPSGSSTGY